MHCPNCGTPEQARVRVCGTCGAAYATEDLQELRQLEFLLAETAAWPGAQEQSQPYAERLAALKARLFPAPPVPAPAMAPAPESAVQPDAPLRRQKVEPAAEQPPARPAPEAVPFDQWLLSERNIKIALYSGGLLLVLAGLIFVGVNWARLPGLVKFVITLLITGLMYLGGYLLFKRPGLKLGGVALLGVGSGFVPLNFIVLQIYVFGERGVSANTMWFIASCTSLLLYLLTTYWTRTDLFTYLSMAALASSLTTGLVLLDAPTLVFALTYAFMLLAFLLGARFFQSTPLAGFTRTPLLAASQLAMPLVFFESAALWIDKIEGCQVCPYGSPWLAFAAMLTAVVFYITTDIAFHKLLARWAAAFAFAFTFLLTIRQLDFSNTATGVTLMTLALAYMLLGQVVERRSAKRSHGWPLYATAYLVAAFVTFLSLDNYAKDPADLAKALIGDALLFALSAWVHRRYNWVYGATWLFIAPVYIYASLYLPDRANQGLALGVLLLIYMAAGYVLGRRALRLGGPFLTAAAFLSLIVTAFTWSNAVVASIALVAIAVLYLLTALWLRWSWLLLPALAAVNLAVLAILRIFFTPASPWERTLAAIYAGLGVALALGAAWLRQKGQKIWGWPLYLVAGLDILGAYLTALGLGGAIAISLSAVFAALAFGLAWIERAFFSGARLPPLLAYLGALFVFTGQFYVIGLSRQASLDWPAHTAGLCALLVALAWLLRREPLQSLYGAPLRRSGSVLMLVPLVGVFVRFMPLLGALTFAIAGTAFAADAALRRIQRLFYLAGSAYIVVIWCLLLHFEVSELQAYTIPLGAWLLAVGWSERRLGGQFTYRLPTLLGLLVLMGSAFFQSFDKVIYAVLLLGESLAALAWGVRIHSRRYVQLGLLSLVVNGIAQFGPGFVELPRWIQLGVIGSILLGGGLVALLRREQLLAARQRLADEWRQWER